MTGMLTLVGILENSFFRGRMVDGSWNAETRHDVQINVFLLKAEGREGSFDRL